jgi:SAM-dependent methyltransferase
MQAGLQQIYKTEALPVFQNKVHPTRAAAHAAVTGAVKLLACIKCGYVFNEAFDASLMRYDAEYQNEQAHSPAFDRYLDSVVDMLERRGFRQGTVVEVGCGKGAFLQKLWARGFDALGFDTAYEGNDPRVFTEYFSERHSHLKIDLLILRHTLEHIEDPLGFLRNLARLTSRSTVIYIEVPSIEWILRKSAFWDVFFEHCNYFSLHSLAAMFERAESGLLFGAQYMYVLAELSAVRTSAMLDGQVELEQLRTLQVKVDSYRHFVQHNPGIVVWGAGAKGCTFVNIVDPGMEHIAAVVDTNAKKVGGFIAKTGHPIVAPAELAGIDGDTILVMNENYLEEVGQMLAAMGQSRRQLYALGQLTLP